MGCVNRQCLSFLVGWLNILSCLIVPVSYFFLPYDLCYEEFLCEDVVKILVSCGFLFLGIIPSIFLLQGIRQNRRKFMAPWIYLTFIQIIIINIGMIVMYFDFQHYGIYAFYYSMYLAVCEGFFILCLIPVTMLYKQLDIPLPILQTQCIVPIRELEDDKRYMPIFDN